MRLFLAVELPEHVLQALEDAIVALQGEHPALSWARADKRHLTLKFLGDVEPNRASSVTAAMDRAAVRHRPFEMEVGGLGAFPSFKRARVLWIGVTQESRLELLHHDVEVSCGEEGFEIEGRAFRPHITLARVRSRLELDAARGLARAAKRIDFSATVPVEEITLFESAQGQYRRLYVAPLTGGR